MTHAPATPIVWTEIPVTDLDAAGRFYEAVFGWTLKRESSPVNDMLVFPHDETQGVSGHLYPGTPATGATTHFVLPDTVEDGAARLREAGGTMLDQPVVEMPFGRFAYALDPGNSIGLFQPAKRDG